MRIYGGTHKGKTLKSPTNNAIRPTSDKIRGSIFNALHARFDLEGLIVLDACCGTGALGLEALSHGAGHAYFMDENFKHLTLAKENSFHLKLEEQCHFFKMDCTKINHKPSYLPPAHLCFLDPPYRKNIIIEALPALFKGGWITPETFLIIEAEKEFECSAELEFERNYGDTKIMMIDGKAMQKWFGLLE